MSPLRRIGRWLGIWGFGLALCVVSAQSGELLSGDASDAWTLTLRSSAAAETVLGETFCVAVADAGRDAFSVSLGQAPFELLDGHRYRLEVGASASAALPLRLKVGQDASPFLSFYTETLALSEETQTFSSSFLADVDELATRLSFFLGGAADTPYEVCFETVSLVDEGPVATPLRSVRVDQLGYLPTSAKGATVASDATEPLPWRLLDAAGTERAAGLTTVSGEVSRADQNAHTLDFSDFVTPGEGYRLEAAGEESWPFDIRTDLYTGLARDALKFFYHSRSGVPIEMPYAESERLERPAGHAPDVATCWPETDCGDGGLELDLTGGWYDNADHGKYVANGGFALWLLQNLFERGLFLGDTEAFADGTLNIPESGNGVPDLLDEARWEMDFLLKMQLPESAPLAGMALHKVHDLAWTALPLAPHEDTQPRYFRLPSTAATLNLAATGAQCARVWQPFDAVYAERCLEAAERAWRSARAHPDLLAPLHDIGGFPYQDTVVTDEFYWAAAELYIATGKPEYEDYIRNDPQFLDLYHDSGNASILWNSTAGLGTLSLALVPNDLTADEIEQARANIVAAARFYVGFMDEMAYPGALRERFYTFAPLQNMLDNLVMMGLAYDFSGDPDILTAVRRGLDYALGRNPLDQVYLTGYGERPVVNIYHRFWAHSLGAAYPLQPPGVAVTGPTPFSMLLVDIEQRKLAGCAAQTCYLDDARAFTVNQPGIFLNAPLAWVTRFLDDTRLK